MPRIVTAILIYYRHQPIDPILDFVYHLEFSSIYILETGSVSIIWLGGSYSIWPFTES
jgi:hypothetical protein